MNRLRIGKIKEKNLIGVKFRHYIDFIILSCCIVIALNIHLSDIEANENLNGESHKMVYIFHDYYGNEYIMNDNTHGTSNSWDYLFNDEIPEDLKGGEENSIDSVSIGDLINQSGNSSSQINNSGNNNPDSIKDNQISINDIISELGIESNNQDKDTNNNSLIINVGDSNGNDNNRYNIKNDDSNNTLIIEKIDNESNSGKIEFEENDKISDNENENLLVAKVFTFVEEGWILPKLVSRNDLYFGDSNQAITYSKNYESNQNKTNNTTENKTKESGIEIIDDYADCMTPWGYKIHHGDSVIAYKQMEDTPDLCHIERRFCRKGKLSGTYTQQGCSINENYTYNTIGDIKVTEKVDDGFNGRNTRQNPDGSVTVKDTKNGGGERMLDIPNKTSSSFSTNENNIREEDKGVPQTSRVYRDCTAPRGEKVKHGDFIQAFKHENGFSDSPCEMQIRLCTMGELLGTYTESRCKTWNTSFIDWINGSPNRGTYSKEKLDLIRKQINEGQIYYENARKNAEKSLDSEALDKILWILDED